MTDKARELLRRILTHLEWTDEAGANEPLEEEIRAYLAEPEVKREAMSEDEVYAGFLNMKQHKFTNRGAFGNGVRFAEKHHGIGGGDE